MKRRFAKRILMTAAICCLLARAVCIGEPDVEEICDVYGLNLPMDMTVYIPENIPAFSFGDIHISTGCTIARNFDLAAVTMREALERGLEPCVSCTYRPLFEAAASAQKEMRK